MSEFVLIPVHWICVWVKTPIYHVYYQVGSWMS